MVFLEAIILHMGWKRFNRVANFLKHAVSDPDARQDLHEVDFGQRGYAGS